jgi:imidazolonepropionase-like amidohydrolase
MTPLLLKNARIFDGTNAECPEGMYLRISDGLIREVSAKPITASDARILDVGGRTVMPGLIDAHMHAYCSDVSMQKIEAIGEPYRTAHAIRMLGHALDCGFTTVRDIGGGDYSLAKAIADGLIRAPRFFYAGKVLSMTGGHGDFRPLEQKSHHHELCSCGIVNWACRLADGVDACIHAARDELRQGAHCIKIMGSGGVASPTDPIWMNQYREDEIRAIVNECSERRTYVAAHCHPSSAIRRCIEFGVRSIEHGTLIDDDTARFAAERGAYIVPTMVVIFTLVEIGRQLGFPAVSQEKAEYAYKQALSGMDKMRSAGVKIGFGTDLLGSTYTQECREFTIRREVFAALELLRQATSINAELMMQQGKLGCIAPGAYADLLVVDGDPLKDISLLAADGKNLRAIVRAGEVVKDQLR